MKGKNEMSRRGFLKAAAAVSAALAIQPAINKVEAANAALNGRGKPVAGKDGMPHRTLGTGKAALDVSALGFGVMGMTYNRSRHPDKEQCIRLLHKAVDRGVTLFDAAIIYGPLTNENLAGEALSEFKGKINVTTKFGRTHSMTSVQVALGWLLQKAPWIVPIPDTTKLSHLEENLHTPDFRLSPEEWRELERAVAAIPVVGDRYNAEQQRQVGH